MRALWVVAIVGALVAPVRADAKADAERFFRAGERAYKASQFEAATAAFEEALALLPVPAIVFSTAQAYRLWYVTDPDRAHLERAVALYRRYLDEQRQGGRVGDAVEYLAELEGTLARLGAPAPSPTAPARAPRTQLMLSSQIDGAIGRIGDREGPLPLTIEVPPGDHEVSAQAPGYAPRQQRATAVEGEFIVVELELEPLPARLRVRTEAGAQVLVDGRAHGEAPLATPIEVPAGRHLVTVVRRGRRAWAEELTVGRGEDAEVAAALRTTPQRRAVPWVLGGAGVIALAAGATALGALGAQGDAEEIDQRRQAGSLSTAEADAYRRAVAEREDLVTATWVLGSAALGTALVGGLLWWFDRPDPGDAVPRIRPVLAPEAAAIAVAGRF